MQDDAQFALVFVTIEAGKVATMNVYQSKVGLVPGSSYSEVMSAVRREYHTIQKRTPRRQPYIRSRYFRKDKIFINQYFDHLKQKNAADRLRRLKYFSAAVEVIRNCPDIPVAFANPNKKNEILHRYHAVTKDGLLFIIQVRENKVTKRKDFMSAFPSKIGTK